MSGEFADRHAHLHERLGVFGEFGLDGPVTHPAQEEAFRRPTPLELDTCPVAIPPGVPAALR